MQDEPRQSFTISPFAVSREVYFRILKKKVQLFGEGELHNDTMIAFIRYCIDKVLQEE